MSESKGFIKRDTFQDRLEQDEKELEELKQQNTQPQEQDDEEPVGAEEATFKKRYGDLRRHSQQMQKDMEDRIKKLEGQLETASRKEMRLPKSEEEVAEWADKYPDVAKIIETIAIKKAKEQSKAYEDRFKEIDSMHANAKREKAEAELLRMHPDLMEIQDDQAFHDWLEDQSPLFQRSVYENTDDAKAAAAVITAYKAEKGIKTKRTSTPKDAAKDVNVRGSRAKPDYNDSNGTIRESQVAKMTGAEYEKYADEIAEAIRTNKFIYDISGNAR